MTTLRGTTSFVTGASAGFGAAITRALVARGGKVVAVARREERLRALREELGEAVHPLALDVGDATAVKVAVDGLPREFADVDVLVNNAGLALGLEPSQRAQLGDWQQMVRTNVDGVLSCTHALLPGMVARNRGHVVNLGSVAAEFPYPGGNVYGATKAFVHQLSLNLRADLLGTAVRVSCIEPGLCGGTEFSEVRFKGDAARAAKVYEGTEPILPEDIAETVCWVLERPPHVNINVISMMPVGQAFGTLAVHRK